MNDPTIIALMLGWPGFKIRLRPDKEHCIDCGAYINRGRAGRRCKSCRERGMWAVVIRFADTGDIHDVVTGFKTDKAAEDWCGVFQDPTIHRFTFLVIQPTNVSEIKLR
jgi:hypothetical protein